MLTHEQRTRVLGWGLTAGLLSALAILLGMAVLSLTGAGCASIPTPGGEPTPPIETGDITDWQAFCRGATGHKWTRAASAGGTKCRLCGVVVEPPPPPPPEPPAPPPKPPPPAAGAPDPDRPEAYQSGFLWKDRGENSGKLRVLLPAAFTGYTTKTITLEHNGAVLETIKLYTVANGNREHYAGSKVGAGYPAGVTVVVETADAIWRWTIDKPGTRRDGAIKPKAVRK